MLTRLTIQNVVLIDHLVVPFEKGLNVLSGETGAGKSILLDALGLALGARGDAALIKAGATQAGVTAEFSGPPPEPVRHLLEEQGLMVDDPLVLRRVIGRDGKSRAFLCDQPIGIGLLRQIGEGLLEVHGQFETHGLLNPANHRALLDAFASTEGLRKDVARAYAAWQTAVEAHASAQAERHRAAAEEDFLKAAVAELNDLAPEAGEIDALAKQRTHLQNREKILDALQTAEKALSTDRASAAANLLTAGKALSRVEGKAEGLSGILAAVDRAAQEVQDASRALTRLMREEEGQGASLDAIEERLFKLRAIGRKHGVGAESLHELQADLRRRLALLLDQGDAVSRLAKEAALAREGYRKKAEDLSAKRTKAAAKLEGAIAKELAPVKLERAVFSVACVRVEEDQWNAEGMDQIAFQAATNPGQTLAPLHKVASGGELARFMLAIKVVLAKADPVPTLVFDEVDAGIGGATASAVGLRLAQLGKDVQVLVVTHSPQVAARAAHHLHVEKKVKAGQTTSRVAPLSGEERVEEIARMLSGEKVTVSARQAAKELMKG